MRPHRCQPRVHASLCMPRPSCRSPGSTARVAGGPLLRQHKEPSVIDTIESIVGQEAHQPQAVRWTVPPEWPLCSLCAWPDSPGASNGRAMAHVVWRLSVAF